jgi:hypothetical protein
LKGGGLKQRFGIFFYQYKRNIFKNYFLLCLGGCGIDEIDNYLFFECEFFGAVWNTILV